MSEQEQPVQDEPSQDQDQVEQEMTQMPEEPPVDHIHQQFHHMSREASMLRNLAQVLNYSVELLDRDEEPKIYLLEMDEDRECVSLNVYEEKKELVARLVELQGTTRMCFIFHGSRWLLQKGDTWKLWDGKSLTPLKSSQASPGGLDYSGSMGDAPKPDMAAPQPPQKAKDDSSVDESATHPSKKLSLGSTETAEAAPDPADDELEKLDES